MYFSLKKRRAKQSDLHLRNKTLNSMHTNIDDIFCWQIEQKGNHTSRTNPNNNISTVNIEILPQNIILTLGLEQIHSRVRFSNNNYNVLLFITGNYFFVWCSIEAQNTTWKLVNRTQEIEIVKEHVFSVIPHIFRAPLVSHII